jgi:hypothetical protein
MTTLTVFGEAGGPNTIAATRHRSGVLTSARSYRELSLELPEGGCPVDLDHNEQHTVGELVFAELGDDERLRCVVVIDGLDLDQADEPVYFSPLFVMAGPGINERSTYIAREASLLAVSLTLATERVGAQPLRWLTGDVRRSIDRGAWPGSWRYNEPLLARCVDQLGQGFDVRTCTATHIVDVRPRHRDDEYPLPPGTWGRDQRPPGPLRHSAPVRGSVLAVR